MSASTRLPTLFIPHGGGPCFFMQPGQFFPAGTWDRMAAHLSGLSAAVGVRPTALLVISAHWDERVPTLYAPAAPHLLYDYYGFPPETYQLQYPAPGAVDLAGRVEQLLAAAAIASARNQDRGFDHGVFIPLKLAFPDADITILQLSLQSGFDPVRHLAIGRALAPLRDEGVLIIGSGMSYHNLRDLRRGGRDEAAEAFDAWLNAAVTEPDQAVRAQRLADWQSAPGSAAAQPEPDHLIPLFVAAGAAETDPGRNIYADHLMGKPMSAFQFGPAAA
ncbi:MAG: dioxygenase [Rhodopseudomonas palustris]|uniref:Dioxygenase n=1 Tax=Rhodopseudomonas palustris TaxID=1076 RepID=A0A933RZU4_RHOPL|nr:dioxygenase [Rhodopseudomonas palustris]